MWATGVLMYILLSGASPFGGCVDQRGLCRAIKEGRVGFSEESWMVVSPSAKASEHN